MGSVKDLEVLEAANSDKPGKARFIYSDRYSVFDWGEMPDNIPEKGAAITLLGAYFFEKLEKMGIPTHYVGLVEDGEVKRLSDLHGVTNSMEIDLLPVIHPGLTGDQYDYSAYSDLKGMHLIPLEVIYRNTLPPGSSVFRRLKQGKITPQDLGLDSPPTPNQKLDAPIIDVSTKLEITDRYIPWQEAGQIAGMSDSEISELKNLTKALNNFISDEYSRIGLVNEDGKIEVGFDSERHLMLVDVLGTLDECRFTLDGMPVSKEIARVYYRNTPWYQAVGEAKQADRQNWRSICTLQPEPLPPRLKKLISQAYCAVTNEITGREWFKDVPPLKDLLEEIREYLEDVNS